MKYLTRTILAVLVTALHPNTTEAMQDCYGGTSPTGMTCPSTHPIKGNFTTYDGSKCIAHPPEGRSYNKTRPERCYATMAEAVSDGCRPARR